MIGNEVTIHSRRIHLLLYMHRSNAPSRQESQKRRRFDEDEPEMDESDLLAQKEDENKMESKEQSSNRNENSSRSIITSSTWEKKTFVVLQNVNDPVRCSFSIRCTTEEKYVKVIRWLVLSPRKDFFQSMLNIMRGREEGLICVSGWQHEENVLFIYTNFEAMRLKGSMGNMYIRVLSPVVSSFIILDFPLMTYSIKEFIRTAVGDFTFKPELNDIIYQEQRNSIP